MPIDTSTLNVLNNTPTAGSGSGAEKTADASERFLKLLVAQMQNQDPLNPMDNAQVTSQMAQINTVTGIEKLNGSVQSLSGQFTQMQALQGASLVGRDVIVPGNKLSIDKGVGQGGFDLSGPADSVKVEILNAGGHVIDTLNLGAQTTGLHSFDWETTKAGTDTNLSFRVTATSGATKVANTALMRDSVNAISTGGDTLTLELERSGSVPYSTVKALN